MNSGWETATFLLPFLSLMFVFTLGAAAVGFFFIGSSEQVFFDQSIEEVGEAANSFSDLLQHHPREVCCRGGKN